MNYFYIGLIILFIAIGGYMTYQFIYNKNINKKNLYQIKNLKQKTRQTGILFFLYRMVSL